VADVAGIDPVLGERTGAVGMLGEQQMAVVMEVADHGDIDVGDDRRYGAGRLIGVHRHTHQLAAGGMQSAHLGSRSATSAVSVLVIDWTAIGWALPTGTPPTLTVTVGVGYSREEI